MNDRIVRARTQLLLKKPFFGYLAMFLEPVEDYKCPTMGTDGNKLYINPDFVKLLTDSQLQGVICHEVLHCGLGHIWRREIRDVIRWNMAADYAVNALILKDGLSLPEGNLYDSQFDDMCAEEIYNRIPEMPTGLERFMDDHSKWGEGNKEDWDSKRASDEWRMRVTQAVQSAKMQGKMPGHLESLIDDLLEPKLEWHEILRDFVLSSAKNNYVLIPSNKKHLWRDIYLPSIKGESISIAVGIDTSGSMSDEDIRSALSEIQGICEQFTEYTLYLIQADYELQDFVEVDEFTPLPDKIKGRGGTNFVPVFDEVNNRSLDISSLIYFTDGYCDNFPKAPPYPVVWLIIGQDKFDPPFGSVIKVE